MLPTDAASPQLAGPLPAARTLAASRRFQLRLSSKGSRLDSTGRAVAHPRRSLVTARVDAEGSGGSAGMAISQRRCGFLEQGQRLQVTVERGEAVTAARCQVSAAALPSPRRAA
mmetsp:Transcript_9124/g.27791  ORF Transcript_9124/g.27791 Transcript_9124/m.27791 type:complete len:114 (+) Transcript_9124:946-1287(+)